MHILDIQTELGYCVAIRLGCVPATQGNNALSRVLSAGQVRKSWIYHGTYLYWIVWIYMCPPLE